MVREYSVQEHMSAPVSSGLTRIRGVAAASCGHHRPIRSWADDGSFLNPEEGKEGKEGKGFYAAGLHGRPGQATRLAISKAKAWNGVKNVSGIPAFKISTLRTRLFGPASLPTRV